jgi:phosphonate metabolism protein (transferase hexapeptide repeat family)
MSGRLENVAQEHGWAYVARQMPERAPNPNKRPNPEPQIDPDASVSDCALGPWTRVGARTSLSEVSMGDYSYIVNDSSAAYAQIGKFCSIARDVRINPGNHPTWRAAQHHFSYRAISYELGDSDDMEFFEWRRADQVVLGHDIWVGHGATILAGVTVGTGAVIGAGAVVSKDVPPFAVVVGVAAQVIKSRFDESVQETLLNLAWWDWEHDRLAAALDDFRTLDAADFCAKHG